MVLPYSSMILHGPLHMVVQVQTYLGITVFPRRKRATVRHHFRFRHLPVFEDVLQALIHLVRHGGVPDSALGLGSLQDFIRFHQFDSFAANLQCISGIIVLGILGFVEIGPKAAAPGNRQQIRALF